jgi:hypothetical protein
MKLIKVFPLIIIIPFFYQCITIIPNQTSNASYNIYGEWRIKSFFSANISAITDQDAEKFVDQIIRFNKDNAVIFSDTCNKPTYNLHRENAVIYISKEYRVNPKLFNLKEDSISIITIECKEQPHYHNEDASNFYYDVIFINKSTAVITYQGFFFFIEKINSLGFIPFEGDTVLCKYREKEKCTGFIIQGTRAKGSPEHVNPVNKDVPKEK